MSVPRFIPKIDNKPKDHKPVCITISNLYEGEMFGFIDVLRPDKRRGSHHVHMNYVPMGHYSYSVTCMTHGGKVMFLPHAEVIKKL